MYDRQHVTRARRSGARRRVGRATYGGDGMARLCDGGVVVSMAVPRKRRVGCRSLCELYFGG